MRFGCDYPDVVRFTYSVWLIKHPKSNAGRELRSIVGRLNTISDREQWGYWVVDLIRWEQKHREYLNQKNSSGPRHEKNVVYSQNGAKIIRAYSPGVT